MALARAQGCIMKAFSKRARNAGEFVGIGGGGEASSLTSNTVAVSLSNILSNVALGDLYP